MFFRQYLKQAMAVYTPATPTTAIRRDFRRLIVVIVVVIVVVVVGGENKKKKTSLDSFDVSSSNFHVCTPPVFPNGAGRNN